MRKTLTVRLQKGSDSAVPCLRCGGFKCEILVLVGEEVQAHTGIHRRCLAGATLKRRGIIPTYGGREAFCADCGERGKVTGHMECQEPGRVSTDARHP